MFSKPTMFKFTYNYLRSTIKFGALSGFGLGFSMCNVKDKPLLLERLVAGSLLGTMYAVSLPFLPLSILYNLDKKINGRYDGKAFNSYKIMYEITTSPSQGFTIYTDQEKHEMYNPSLLTKEFLTREEYCKRRKTDRKVINDNIRSPSISPLTGEELQEMRDRINKKK